jgi:hypothetical protein
LFERLDSIRLAPPNDVVGSGQRVTRARGGAWAGRDGALGAMEGLLGFRQLAAFVNDLSVDPVVILGRRHEPAYRVSSLRLPHGQRPEGATNRTLRSGRASRGHTSHRRASIGRLGVDRTIIAKFAFRSSDSLTIAPLSHGFERGELGNRAASPTVLAIVSALGAGKICGYPTTTPRRAISRDDNALSNAL